MKLYCNTATRPNLVLWFLFVFVKKKVSTVFIDNSEVVDVEG